MKRCDYCLTPLNVAGDCPNQSVHVWPRETAIERVNNYRTPVTTLLEYQADLKAAQVENARLREVLKGVRTIINPMPESNASYEAQLDFVLDQEIDAIEAIDKALQPVEVKAHDIAYVRNGDDDVPYTPDTSMSNDDVVDMVCGK